jgi:hypothetical protein
MADAETELFGGRAAKCVSEILLAKPTTILIFPSITASNILSYNSIYNKKKRGRFIP